MAGYVNPNFGNPIIYWMLRFLLFFSLLITGYLISYKMKSVKKYWYFSTPVMILYTLIEGLRYMRSWDYPHYMYDLTKGLWVNYSEPIYTLWANSFRSFEIPFVYGFLFYSAVLAFSFFLLLRNFHKAAVWACPLFLVIPNQSTNLIRMFFAMAFLLIGIHLLINGKKKSYLYLISSGLIHFSVVPVVLLVILLNLKKVGILSKHAFKVLTAYFAIAIFWDIEWFNDFTDILSLIDTSNFEQGQVYLDNAENWFGTDGDIHEKYGFKKAGIMMTTLNACVPAYIMFYGYKAYNNCPKIKIILGCTIFAFFVKQIGGDIELYSRYYHWMTCLIPIVIGVIWYKVRMKEIERLIFILVISFYYYVANFLYYLFIPSSTGYGFIWDKP